METKIPNKTLLFLRIQEFAISCARQKNKNLIGKPLVILNENNKGTVAACSQEALLLGLHTGMNDKKVKSGFPEVLIRRGNLQENSKSSAIVTEILSDYGLELEKVSLEEFYVDLSPLAPSINCHEFALKLTKKITEKTGFQMSFGLSFNKMLSKIAADLAKPGEGIEISKEVAQVFLDPLPVGKLPAVSEVVAQVLAGRGIRKIGVLRQMPKPMLESLFGKPGTAIWLQAHGNDNSALVPCPLPGCIVIKEVTNVKSEANVKSLLNQMARQAAQQLHTGKKLAGWLSLTITYNDNSIETNQLNISYTCATEVIVKAFHDLLHKKLRRNIAVAGLRIRVSDMINSSYSQLSLFDGVTKNVRSLTGESKWKLFAPMSAPKIIHRDSQITAFPVFLRN